MELAKHNFTIVLDQKSAGFLALVFTLLICFSCSQEESSYSILDKTKEKINSHGSVSYNYRSFWDNKFNDSENRDTNYVELEKLNDDLHVLKYHVSNSNRINYFDGDIEKEIYHDQSRIVNHDPEVIASDSAYFHHRTNLMAQPSHFLDIDSSYTTKDSLIKGRSTVLFTTSEESISDSKKIQYIETYAIDKDSYEPWIIEATSIVNEDTVQIITHYFQDIEYSNTPIDFEKARSYIQELGYAEIAANDRDNEMYEKQLETGHKILGNTYVNMLGDETTIFGKQDKRTVMMFSFIGCGGCEYAMKEMGKKNYEFNRGLDFYYSSPTDKSSVLAEYLPKKGFNGIGFSKDSKMNEQFMAYHFPTFFIIDSSGTVTDIYHGYNDEFEAEIF